MTSIFWSFCVHDYKWYHSNLPVPKNSVGKLDRM